jgi:hypothetical protein
MAELRVVLTSVRDRGGRIESTPRVVSRVGW